MPLLALIWEQPASFLIDPFKSLGNLVGVFPVEDPLNRLTQNIPLAADFRIPVSTGITARSLASLAVFVWSNLRCSLPPVAYQ